MRNARWFVLLMFVACGSSAKPAATVPAGKVPAPPGGSPALPAGSKVFDLSSEGIAASMQLPADAVVSKNELEGEEKTKTVAAAFWGAKYPGWSLRVMLNPSRPPDRVHGADVVEDKDLPSGWATIFKASDTERTAHVWRSDLQISCVSYPGTLEQARQIEAMCLSLQLKP